jgi:apolipoprotein D and lipocalin family protein
MTATIRRLGAALLLAAVTGCRSMPEPMPTVDHVDLKRFMGDWYVIANIPTRIERGAHNAVESYRLDDDGTIATTFTFNAGAFDGPRKEYNPRGFVRDTRTNATWGMQFIWPIKAEYLVVYLDEDYTKTVIGRSARDYVWIMARTPQIPEPEYQAILRRVGELGYDVSSVQRVPQRWPSAGEP